MTTIISPPARTITALVWMLCCTHAHDTLPPLMNLDEHNPRPTPPTQLNENDSTIVTPNIVQQMIEICVERQLNYYLHVMIQWFNTVSVERLH